ncbi:flagellar biosynthesis protein FlhF [Marinimicrobium alkaliphilum]|uniref:flagellar biosynthesis protein FlhF n=1 Tax=Marinimicrobium alkaliphilum TaxID=2202654 RepID=UPI000DB96F6A|nr:flagellar biosynthesis protein FlhF [Marinimicrobium alkaliphilum]
MQVKRFVAADMRRALELVRQELGSDAIILSSKRTPEGVELVTTLAADTDHDPLGIGARAPVPEAEPRAGSGTGLPGGKTGRQIADDIEQASQRLAATRAAEASAREHLLGQGPGRAEPARRAPVDPTPVRYAAEPANQNNAQLNELQAELADMRLLLEQQLHHLAGDRKLTGSPVLDSVGRRLERVGLPTEAIAAVLGGCKPSRTLASAWPEALAQWSRELPVAGRDVTANGGVFAFVGATGAGKTTTIGKLAARYVLEHGADKVALVTMDNYRIAGHDQLRSMARILKVPVRVVDEHNSLAGVLHSLRRCELVLIDTAGFRHGDPKLKAQLSELAEQTQVRSYLVMASNSQAQMLKAAIHAYASASLRGCILTKLDETASLGEALGVVMHSDLPIAYTTDGQDIPQDIEVARAHTLVARAAALLSQQQVPLREAGAERGLVR